MTATLAGMSSNHTRLSEANAITPQPHCNSETGLKTALWHPQKTSSQNILYGKTITVMSWFFFLLDYAY